MVRVIVAVVLAACVQFAWGFVFYGSLSSLDYMTTRAPDESAVTEALKSTLPESGTYIVPMCPGMNASDEAAKAHEKRAAEGPTMTVHYRKDGFSMAQMPVVMGAGFVHMLLTGLLAAFLLRLALPGLGCYSGRVLFVFGLGVFAALATRLGDIIWFRLPWAYPLGQTVYCVVAWLLAGVVMGAIIRPGQQQTVAKPHRDSIAA
jgi:hypothetical protein